MELVRRYRGDRYTIGSLFINSKYYCDTLEDVDRGLTSQMTPDEIKAKKIPGETAIPTGTYKVTTQYWSKHRITVPAVHDVPGFTGILIHNGANERDTLGCILVGRNTVKGGLTEGKLMMVCVTKLVAIALKKHEEVTLTIH